MAKVHKVDYDTKAFLVDVTGMRALDIAVYWVICSLIMADNRPILRDDERIFGVLNKDHPNAINGAITRLIERRKAGRAAGLDLTAEGHLSQTKATHEVDKARTRIRKAVDAAEARWGSRSESDENQSSGDADAKQGVMPSSSSSTTTHSVEDSSLRSESAARPSGQKAPKPKLITITQEFTLTPEDRAYAEQRGWTAQRIADVLAGFVDWHTNTAQGLKRRYVDAHRAWQGWVRREDDRAGAGGGQPGHGAGRSQGQKFPSC